MKGQDRIAHEFVEFIPDELVEGTVYISIKFATALHRCCCGCGQEVVTPLSPTDWKLTFDGKSVSLHPSVGNWSFPCRSHYWIRNNTVEWAAQMSNQQIEAGRAHDRFAKDQYFGGAQGSSDAGATHEPVSAPIQPWWRKLWPWS